MHSTKLRKLLRKKMSDLTQAEHATNDATWHHIHRGTFM